MTEPNDYLWFLPDHLGRWFWVPLMGFGIWGMWYMYRLAAPVTRLGRIIRVVLSMGYLGLIGSIFMNGLGPFSFYLITVGSILHLKQVYGQCLAAGKIKPISGSTIIEKLANKVVERGPS